MPIHTANLTVTFLGANQVSQPLPLILIAAAFFTGFLNPGLKRLLKSSQSLLVRLRPHLRGRPMSNTSSREIFPFRISKM